MGFFIPIQHSVALAKAMGGDTGDWRYSPLETTPNRIEWEWGWEVSASLQILFRGDLPGGGMYPGKYLTESAEANHCTRRQLDPSSNFITVHPRDQPTNDQRHQLNRAPQVSTFYAYQWV